jgi:hypothetical protein
MTADQRRQATRWRTWCWLGFAARRASSLERRQRALVASVDGLVVVSDTFDRASSRTMGRMIARLWAPSGVFESRNPSSAGFESPPEISDPDGTPTPIRYGLQPSDTTASGAATLRLDQDQRLFHDQHGAFWQLSPVFPCGATPAGDSNLRRSWVVAASRERYQWPRRSRARGALDAGRPPSSVDSYLATVGCRRRLKMLPSVPVAPYRTCLPRLPPENQRQQVKSSDNGCKQSGSFAHVSAHF